MLRNGFPLAASIAPALAFGMHDLAAVAPKMLAEKGGYFDVRSQVQELSGGSAPAGRVERGKTVQRISEHGGPYGN